MGFHAQSLEFFDIVTLDGPRCASAPNIPEKTHFRACRRAMTTGIRGWQAVGRPRPSIYYGKVGWDGRLDGRRLPESLSRPDLSSRNSMRQKFRGFELGTRSHWAAQLDQHGLQSRTVRPVRISMTSATRPTWDARRWRRAAH